MNRGPDSELFVNTIGPTTVTMCDDSVLSQLTFSHPLDQNKPFTSILGNEKKRCIVCPNLTGDTREGERSSCTFPPGTPV